MWLQGDTFNVVQQTRGFQQHPRLPKTSFKRVPEVIDLVGSKLRVQQLPKRLETVEKLDLVSKLFCLRCRDP